LYWECAEYGSGIGESNIRSVQTLDRWINDSRRLQRDYDQRSDYPLRCGWRQPKKAQEHLGKPMSFIETLDVHL